MLGRTCNEATPGLLVSVRRVLESYESSVIPARPPMPGVAPGSGKRIGDALARRGRLAESWLGESLS